MNPIYMYCLDARRVSEYVMVVVLRMIIAKRNIHVILFAFVLFCYLTLLLLVMPSFVVSG